ncbi:RNA ligase [Terracoccus sp. 273MFTsu3.1]|uniref:RNA ligase n=1 Tax=Terracoccus sp. 273MFTsu3.1 TaxID=1172188 RepID=UPI00037B831F|nr:RNA ligase [Terracoccus sp. 273MFTsu3.1]
MLLRSLIEPLLLQNEIDAGYITVRSHPDDADLKILNYTDNAQYDDHWTPATLQCRGLIVHGKTWETAVVRARPFDKFFNLGQAWAPTLFPDTWVTAYDKMDGSLGILYVAPDGLLSVATRGAFTSEQALHATRVYRERYAGKWHEESANLGILTYLFEIIYPENRVVLNYGEQDDLVLLGCRKISTGLTDTPKFVRDVDGWPGPITETLHRGSMAEVMAAPDRKNAEGMVLVLNGSEERVKVKQEDYVALHRIIFGLNERVIWTHMAVAACKDLITEPNHWGSYLRMDPADAAASLALGDDWLAGLVAGGKVPDEVFPWIEATTRRIAAERRNLFRHGLGLAESVRDMSPFEQHAALRHHPLVKEVLHYVRTGDPDRLRIRSWAESQPEGNRPFTYTAAA